MTVPVATIAEQALRRLGVAIVPVADRQMLNDMVPPATIAEAALRQLGVEVVPEADRPALTVTVSTASARYLRPDRVGRHCLGRNAIGD